MLLKNTSQKVIHVGHVMILPDEVKTVDDSLLTAPAVAALIARKSLTVEKAPVKASGNTSGKDPAAEETGDKEPPLSRMNKQELTAKCAELGIEVTEDDTKDTLLEKIKAATAG